MPRPDPARVLADIGRRVAELRRERKWVQAELAERMDVTLRHIQRIEAGEKNLTVRSLVLLAHVLRTHPTEFLSQPLSRARRTAGRPRKNAG